MKTFTYVIDLSEFCAKIIDSKQEKTAILLLAMFYLWYDTCKFTSLVGVQGLWSVRGNTPC